MLLGYWWSCYDDQSTSSAVLFASPADTEAGGCGDGPVAFCPGKTRTHSRLIPDYNPLHGVGGGCRLAEGRHTWA